MKLSSEAEEVWNKTFQVLRTVRVRNIHFEVCPRYTAGSPALVNEQICCQEAVDEREFYRIALEGVWGPEKKRLAETKGLKWICFARWEKGKKVFRYDLITGETIQEPPRLDYDDEQTLKMLRKHVEIFGVDAMTPKQKDDMKHLEFRAMLHRQEFSPDNPRPI